MADYSELKRLAEKAAALYPPPYEVDNPRDPDADDADAAETPESVYLTRDDDGLIDILGCLPPKLALYVAAADPTTVIGLLDEIAELKALLGAAREATYVLFDLLSEKLPLKEENDG